MTQGRRTCLLFSSSPNQIFHLVTFSWLLPFPRPLSPLPPTVTSNPKCHLSGSFPDHTLGKIPRHWVSPLFSPLAKAHSSAQQRIMGAGGKVLKEELKKSVALGKRR